jgi:hypothetical protein
VITVQKSHESLIRTLENVGYKGSNLEIDLALSIGARYV